jgi:hypothetical protein
MSLDPGGDRGAVIRHLWSRLFPSLWSLDRFPHGIDARIGR